MPLEVLILFHLLLDKEQHLLSNYRLNDRGPPPPCPHTISWEHQHSGWRRPCEQHFAGHHAEEVGRIHLEGSKGDGVQHLCLHFLCVLWRGWHYNWSHGVYWWGAFHHIRISFGISLTLYHHLKPYLALYRVKSRGSMSIWMVHTRSGRGWWPYPNVLAGLVSIWDCKDEQRRLVQLF
jgi:hypothetical protein